jgi:hypothetical protein
VGYDGAFIQRVVGWIQHPLIRDRG